MTKYAQIYQLVCRLTDDLDWRTFFISFLLATDACKGFLIRDFGRK